MRPISSSLSAKSKRPPQALDAPDEFFHAAFAFFIHRGHRWFLLEGYR